LKSWGFIQFPDRQFRRTVTMPSLGAETVSELSCRFALSRSNCDFVGLFPIPDSLELPATLSLVS
jgi:hypothetical protein